MDENFSHEDKEKNEGGEVLAQKSGFITWLDNFWYHYKWQTLISLFFIVLITVCTLQMCQKESYDLYVLYAGPAEIERKKENGDLFSDYEMATSSLASVASDYDKNSKTVISLKDLFLLTSEQIAEAEKDKDNEVNYVLLNDNKNNFIETLRYSDYYLCFLSEELYNEYKTMDDVPLFEDLTKYRSEASTAEFADSSAVYLRSTGFSDKPIFEDLPENTVICLKKVSALASKFDKKDSAKNYKRAEEVISKIINTEKK